MGAGAGRALRSKPIGSETREPPTTGEAAPEHLTRVEMVKGNGSILLFTVGAVLFYFWDWCFKLPEATPLALDVGPLELAFLSKGAMSTVVGVVLGWLGISALISLESFAQVPRNIWRPLRLVRSLEIQQFFASTPTFLAAVFFLLGVLNIAAVNWSIPIRTTYEVVVDLPPGQGVALFGENREPLTGVVHVGQGSQLRMVGLRPHDEAAVVVRDKYNLVTLEVICIGRGWISLSLTPCERLAPGGDSSKGTTPRLEGARAVAPFGLELYGPLRGAATKVELPMHIHNGVKLETLVGGWIEPGEAKDGPELPEQEYARRFLTRLYDDREEFSSWSRRTSTETEWGRAVLIGLGDYEIKVVFVEESHARSDRDWTAKTREATHVVVHKR